ncbi:MAG: hypothetical protein WA667_19735, partial [Candidatus Nitrosopolaris sp.]
RNHTSLISRRVIPWICTQRISFRYVLSFVAHLKNKDLRIQGFCVNWQQQNVNKDLQPKSIRNAYLL